MSLAQKYEKSKELKWSLRFSTFHPEGDKYYGVVTHVRRQFIVLFEHQDFFFDGIVVLPKRMIKACRDSKYDKCANEVLRFNGNIKQVKAPKWLDDCTTLKQIVETLKRRDIWPAVEIIYKLGRKTKTDFFVGKISRIEKDAFFIYDYSAAGKWQGEWEIGYDEVFRIQFNDLYTKYFNAFMRTRLPKNWGKQAQSETD